MVKSRNVVIPENHGKGNNPKSVIERARRMRLYHAQSGACHWCQMEMSVEPFFRTAKGRLTHNQKYASIEHVIPKYMGGWNHPNNLVLAHADCNNGRARRRWPHDPIYGNGVMPDVPLKPTPAQWAAMQREEHRSKLVEALKDLIKEP